MLAELCSMRGCRVAGARPPTVRNEDAGLLLPAIESSSSASRSGGSVPVGDINRRRRKKKVVLELGGNARRVVHRDADLPLMQRNAASVALLLAGKTCLGTADLVEHSVYGKFITDFW